MSVETVIGNLNEYLIKPLASLLKCMLRSKLLVAKEKRDTLPARPMVIMGNGPSLRGFIEYAGANPDEIGQFDLQAVNFAAISPEYFILRPRMYTLADPHFFEVDTTDAKVDTLWANLAKTDWKMQLWVPLSQKKAVEKRIAKLPADITIKWYNLTPVEGRGALVNMLIDKGMGMPRPRNVLIAAIMNAIQAGYEKIFLVGADHSWIKSLWVDDANKVVSVQPHFYKDDEKERRRVEAEYAGYHLHDILGSMTVAFKSYFDILHHAQRRHVEIINATPESFIDAFPRCDYAQMNKLSKK